MTNWKDVWEIPDSEDEDGFDSQPSAIPHASVTTKTASSHVHDPSDDFDIWDVPDSDQELEEQEGGDESQHRQIETQFSSAVFKVLESLESSPLSSARSDIDLPPIDQLVFAASQTSQSEEPEQNKPPPNKEPQTPGVDSPADRPQLNKNELRVQLKHASPLRGSPLRSEELGEDVEQHQAQQAAIRYERSLRPRKPIQEHPYLLENAHYSSALKRHGVKPWRVAVESEHRKRQQTLPDEDFEEESQESGPQAVSEESLPNETETTEDFGGLDIPSSSPPPETSPLNIGGAPSSQPSLGADTDDTSVFDQDLPALEDLLRPSSLARSVFKRRTTSPKSTPRKRRRHNVDLPEAGPRLIIPPDISKFPTSPSHSPRPREHLAKTTVQPPLVVESSSDEEEAQLGAAVPDDDVTASDNSASERESEKDMEALNTIGRRIRGVLPASWLRLDQQSGRDKVKTKINQPHRDRIPDREGRRGVAQLRVTPINSYVTHVWSDDSEDDDPVVVPPTTDDEFPNQTTLDIEPAVARDIPQRQVSDDEESVVEEDVVDHMAPTRKRQLKIFETFDAKQKRSNKGGSRAAEPQRKRQKQTQNTTHIGSSRKKTLNNLTTTHLSLKSSSKKKLPSASSQRKNQNSRAHSPPRLSILDIIEPNAPRFLKIAARAAKGRRNQGRSNPKAKSIRLATREDHVDAVSILNAWKLGTIKPRLSVSDSIRGPAKPAKCQPQPLVETSGNTSSTPRASPKPRVRASQKLVKHVSSGGSISFRATGGTHKLAPKQQDRSVDQVLDDRSARPAQLETDGVENIRGNAFHSRKKFLDRVYRRAFERRSPSASIADLGSEVDNQLPARWSMEKGHQPARAPTNQTKQSRRHRLRKQSRPRRIDIEEPQYSHANDPLPTEYFAEPEVAQGPVNDGKLFGLGPYGTTYTVHFERFPLDSRVYFHESTLIGSGMLRGCLTSDITLQLGGCRPVISHTLDTQILRWSMWNAQVSSELGIVMDYIVEKIESSILHNKGLDDLAAVETAGFVLRFAQGSLTFAAIGDAQSFMARAFEVFGSFNKRINVCLETSQQDRGPSGLALKVYDRLLLVVWVILSICRNEPSLMSEQFQAEGLLKETAKAIMSILSKTGLHQIRETYNDLNSIPLRERGLRDDRPCVHSWVVVMHLLDQAHIPRTSFWDVAEEVMAPLQDIQTDDVNKLEQLWKDLFTLLPLVEFNHDGVIVSGRRHDATSEGWALPQKLLKQVFHLYKRNPRQSASFNNYCRALVSRCHYLVQQWGWRRSLNVIGVIFDFFGSHNLAHLRNEEVHTSPGFLERLADNPKLDIEPKDRCFHVFLKLVALSIKKLSEVGLTKDIRNLVVRTTPNHNRQHLKEQNVHQRDLAALRNHHDLLGTLFWASPPDMRPSAGLIQRLVVPESSHKEACLINLRSWSQLARFVVASGEAATAFKPFHQWRNSFFQQILQQFDSVTSDIQQQLSSLPKDVHQSVSPDMIKTMIDMNKTAVMQVLRYSVRVSLDVMNQAPELESATFCLNALQLHHIFKHFCVAPPELDWEVLQASLETLNSFLDKIDKFKENEESQQSESQILSSAQADDALLLLDHDITRSFFSMARCVLLRQKSNDLSAQARANKEASAEQIVKLSARMGASFISGGLIKLSDMFRAGKYGLFDGPPPKPGCDEHRYLILFVASLLQHGFDDISDAGFTFPELWALSVVKPRECLKHERQLGEQLQRLGKQFIPEQVSSQLATISDYNTRRDLFEYLISWMRCSIRDAGPSLQKILLEEHSKTLKMVMGQIKGDLELVKEHESYVVFAQEVIALIKVHGSDICKVDDFFYRISKVYWPSAHDPQLQIAGLVSYGHRFRDGDNKSGHQLFFVLFNNVKFSLANDKLKEQFEMLCKAMENQGIIDFILGKMLPAIIRATCIEDAATLLLQVYVGALHLLLSEKAAAKELDEEDLPQLVVLARSFLESMSKIASGDGACSVMQIHVMTQVLMLQNFIWPSLHVLAAQSTESPAWDMLHEYLESVKHLVSDLERCLMENQADGFTSIDRSQLFHNSDGLEVEAGPFEADVDIFTENIVQDIRNSWTVSPDSIKIGKSGMAAPKDIAISLKSMEEARDELLERVQEWLWWWERVYESPSICDVPVNIL